MNWLNLKTHIRTKPEFIGSEPAQRATWLCLMFYCIEHENAGAINDCTAWGDRQWQQTCGITKDEVYSTCKLWNFDRSSLVIWGYPIEQERECLAKREAGRKGGKNSAAARKRIAAEQNQAEIEAQLEAKVEAELQRKGKERKGIENKGNTPCSGGGAAAAPVTEQGKHNFILHRPEMAFRVDLSDELNLHRADPISLACTICDAFPDRSGRSGPGMGKFTAYLKTLGTEKGSDAEACEIVRPMLIQFWSEIKAGEDPYSRTAVMLTKMTRLLEAHGCS